MRKGSRFIKFYLKLSEVQMFYLRTVKLSSNLINMEHKSRVKQNIPFHNKGDTMLGGYRCKIGMNEKEYSAKPIAFSQTYRRSSF